MRRAAPFGGRLPANVSLFSSEEHKLIQELLELLRSGALASLMPTVFLVVSISVMTPNIQKQKKNSTSRDTNVESTTLASGWKPVKSAKSTALETRDKLLPNGWSVPTKNTITEMSFFSTLHLFCFESRSTQTCEAVKGRTRSRDLGVIQHHWIMRGGACLS